MYMNNYFCPLLQQSMPRQAGRPNWAQLIKRWVLLYSKYKKWIFGELVAYDTANGKLTISALRSDGQYESVEEFGSNITDGWVVDKWTQIIGRGTCVYQGQTYSDGAIISVNGECLKCSNGEWEEC